MESKKVLIIAHFYEPCNVIAAHRPKSWAKALKESGFEPVILTRHWTGKERNWDELLAETSAPQSEEERNGIRVVSLPYKKTGWHRLATSGIARKFRIVRFGIEWLASLFGRIEIDRDVNKNYFAAADELLKRGQFSLILVTCNPYIGVRLAGRLSRKHAIPWVADFRDLWDNSVQMTEPGNIPFTEKVRFMFYNRILLKWVKEASNIIICSEAFIPFFQQKLPDAPVTLIKNGFEANLFQNYPDTSNKNPVFTILCAGTLYPQQDKKTFADGVKQFLAHRPDAKIQLRFIGVKVNPSVAQEIENLLPAEIRVTTEFVNRDEALRELKNAHVLFYPVWAGYYGIYSGKLFEYLGAGKNVLIAPNDHGILEQTLWETKAGAYPDTADDVTRQLEKWYAEWEQNGTIGYYGDQQAIARYTREHQASILVDLVKQLTDNT